MMYGGYGMGGGGIIWLLIMGALLIVPFWRILPRHGLPSWLAIVAVFPLFALILLWVIAFKDQIAPDEGTR